DSAQQSQATSRRLDRKYIDPALVQYWRSYCENHHGLECSQPRFRLSKPLAWLIDCKKKCLVAESDGGICQHSYVALSYVWGQTPRLKTVRANVSAHQEEGVQCHIDQMAIIFENAVLTIVAGDGTDADHGIRGIRNISQPRVLNTVLRLTDDISLVARQGGHLSNTVWSTRGWTMQESIFSRRRIEFFDNSIRWSCQQNGYFEDVDSPLDLDRNWAMVINTHSHAIDHMCLGNISTSFPNIRRYFELVQVYNSRVLTFDHDALRAFNGTLNVLQYQAFSRGFLHGLPVSFLDAALVWRPAGSFGKLRAQSLRDSAQGSLPSWTWAGWKAGIRYDLTNFNYIKSFSEVRHIYDTLFQVIPTLDWHIRTSTSPDTEPVRIPFQNEWYQWKC
ncbi:hypothetical protein B0H67DRAFT_487591, partial [Lasiosphaeris hirsuta]